MKRIKLILTFIFIIIVFIFAGCAPVPKGSVQKSGHPELYAVTYHTVLGNNRDIRWDTLDIVEEDMYGRVMFKYRSGSWFYKGNYLYSMVICQKADENYAYYYDDFCFIVSPSESEFSSDFEFSDEKVNRLKELNDWGKELDEDKMTKVEIEFSQKPSYPSDKTENILESYLNKKKDEYVYQVVTSDSNGKCLIFARECQYGETEEGQKKIIKYFDAYVFIINADGTYNENTFVDKLEDVCNYQDQLHEFKKLNNWNKE